MIPSNYFGEIPAAGRSGRGTGGAGRALQAPAPRAVSWGGGPLRSGNRGGAWGAPPRGGGGGG